MIDTLTRDCYNITIMLIYRLKLFVYALLLVLFWSQFALAQHSLEHISHESVETCEVCKHTNESADLCAKIEQVPSVCYGAKTELGHYVSISIFCSELRSARSPPY